MPFRLRREPIPNSGENRRIDKKKQQQQTQKQTKQNKTLSHTQMQWERASWVNISNVARIIYSGSIAFCFLYNIFECKHYPVAPSPAHFIFDP